MPSRPRRARKARINWLRRIHVDFGGDRIPLGQAMAILQAEGYDQLAIDRWVQGALVTEYKGIRPRTSR